MSLILCY